MKTVQIEIPVSELKAALPGLSKVAPRSTSLPVLGCIKVALSADRSTITLQAHNLDEIATLRLENKSAGQPGELLIPLDLVSKLIKGCSAGEAMQFIGTKEETRIRYPVAGNLVDRLVSHTPTSEWPEVKNIPAEPIALDVSFKAALREALESASTDSSRYVLNGACLDTRAKEAHYVVGTDGRHLYSANSFQFGLPEPLIVPTRKFLTWPAFVNDGPWKLRMLPAVRVDPEDTKADKSKEEPAWFQIESDRWTYIAKAIDGQYPNWKQVLPTDTAKWTRLVLAPPAIQALQQAIPLLPGSDLMNQTIVLEIGKDVLALRARGKDDKEDTRMQVADVRIDGHPVEVALNRAYLLKALRFGFNELQVEDSLTPIVFSSPSKTMIVMPVRIEGPTPTTPAPAAAAAPAVATEPAAAQGASTPQPPSPSNENACAGSPSPARVDNPTTETTTPERTNTVMTPVNRLGAAARANSIAGAAGNGNGSSRRAEESDSALDVVMNKIDALKGNLRQVIADLAETQNLIKAAAKEKKATEKDVESVRSALRSLQKVEL